MKIMMIGDIYGRSGRDALEKHLPELRRVHAPNFVIVNADNASHGAGITAGTVRELYAMGVDLLTGGDHVWDQKDLLPHLDRAPWVLRPLNYPTGTPGKGFHILETPDKRKLLVIHALGRVFMEKVSDNPFTALDKLLSGYTLGGNVAAILIDFHAEASSEKNALAYYLDGRVSAILGTHTHIPTGDARVLTNGTAYITDLGMTGDYNSVIGADKDAPIATFRTGLKLSRLSPATGEGTICGALVETDDQTGKAIAIKPFRIGGEIGE